MTADAKFIMQAIASNDREETEWSDFIRTADAMHLCDIFRDLRIAEEALRHGTTAAMLKDINFVCCHPLSVAAMRLAVATAVVRVRSELIERARAGRQPGDAPGGVSEVID